MPTVLNVCCLAKATKERTQYSSQQHKKGAKRIQDDGTDSGGADCCAHLSIFVAPIPIAFSVHHHFRNTHKGYIVCFKATRQYWNCTQKLAALSFLLGSVSLLQLRVESFCQRFGLPCLVVESSHTNEASKCSRDSTSTI